MGESENRTVREAIGEVRRRVERRTFVQDIFKGTGKIDGGRVAAKFNNLEHVVDELAAVVERVVEHRERKSA